MDAIHFLSIFPKSSILARRTAHRTCGFLARRVVNRKSPVVTVKHDDYDNEEGSLLGGWLPPHGSRLKITLNRWAQMKRDTISMWSSSGLKVSHLIHLVELAKLHGDATFFSNGYVLMTLFTILFISVCVCVCGGGGGGGGLFISLVSHTLT